MNSFFNSKVGNFETIVSGWYVLKLLFFISLNENASSKRKFPTFVRFNEQICARYPVSIPISLANERM